MKRPSAGKGVAAIRAEIQPPQSTWPIAITASVCLAVLVPFIAGLRLAGGPVFVYHPHSADAPDSPVIRKPSGSSALSPGGPDYVLQPGIYSAVFDIRQGAQSATEPAARLDIVLYSAAGVRSVTREIPRSPDVSGKSRYEGITFAVSAPSIVDIRLFHYGSTESSVDEISVWPQTYSGPSGVRAIAWIGSAAGIVILAGLWFGFRGPAASKVRRAAGLISTIYFSVLAGWVVNILVRAAPNGFWSPVSEPVLPVIFWVPALLLGGLGINAFLRDPSHVRLPALLAAQIACGPAVLLALGLSSWDVSWTSISSIALSLWAAETCLALTLFAHQCGKLRRTRSGAIAAYVFVGLFLWYEQYPVSGDQGSYLTETAALVSHGTVNVLPVLASGEVRTYAPYTSVQALRGDTLSVDGVAGYPARDLGVPILSIPGYLAGRLKGARIEMEIVATILAILVFELVRRSGVRHSVAVFAWAVTCFSLPLLHYSSQIYPELLGAVLTVLALLQLRTQLTSRSVMVAGICAGLLPWFSARYWLLALPILIVVAVRLGRGIFSGKGLALFVPVIASSGLAMAVNMTIYHIPLPNAGYFMVLSGANPAIYVKSAAGPFSAHFYEGWLGLWLDREWGLFATAPIFALVPAGLYVLWQRERLFAAQVLVIGIPYFLAVASTSFWWGGPTATPRYLTPLLPLMAVPIASVLEEYWSPGVRLLAAFLAAAGGLTAAAAIVNLDSDYVGIRLAAYCKDAYGFTISEVLPPSGHLQNRGLTWAWVLVIVVFPITVRWLLQNRSRHS